MRDVILTTEHLSKKYQNTTVLHDINLKIEEGEIYGLVGKNGAGKTTLLRLISGQAFPTEGSMSLFQANTQTELNRERRRLGVIIETPSFYPKLTAIQNLEYYRIQRGIPGKECVQEALEEVGLSGAGNKKFRSFSLGMKQRLGLALALMNKPEIMLLDEPINGLDPFGIVEIRNLLLKLNREKHITIVISSHILSELSNLVTYYGFIHNGKMVKQISGEDLSKECNKYLEVRVDQIERMTAMLETELGCTNYRITPENSIQIFDYLEQPSVISSLAAKHNLLLNEITVKDINLEKYFIQLVGGNGNE